MAQPPAKAGSELDADSDRRPPGGTAVTVVLLVLAGLLLAWSALWFLELDVNRYTAALVALMQYAVPAGVVISLSCLLLRRWLTTLLAGLVTVALFLSVAPRTVPDSPVEARGHTIRVLTVNLHLGEADARRIVELVRKYPVDVLSLQELTGDAAERLDRAGLEAQLPFRVFQAQSDGSGSGIASRYPLHQLPIQRSTTLRQPAAKVSLPERNIEFVDVHPIYPVGTGTDGEGTTRVWRKELISLPDPEKGSMTHVLAGDFNATLDHTPMRRLLGKGYRDAAEVIGDGLRATWPSADGPAAPPVTIDHVLISGGVAVRAYHTFDVARTDHRAVLTALAVPGKE